MEVYDRYSGPLFACALAVTGCSGLAEDAVQTVFCRALGLNHKPENLEAYIFQSVKNAAVDLKRKHQLRTRWTKNALFECASWIDPPDWEQGDFLEHIASAFYRLGTDEQEIVIAHLVGGLKFREIAELRQQPMGTVTSHYQRGLKKLRQWMEKNDG